MFKIIGGDQKEYGPISADVIRQWIAEGRANAQTRVQVEGEAEWKALGTIPEFAAAMAAKYQQVPPLTPPPTVTSGAPMVSEAELLANKSPIRVGECVSRGFNLLSKQFGLVFGASAIFLLINGGLGALGGIPFIGILFSLASMAIAGPLMGGLYRVILLAKRGQPAEVGEVFWGFKNQFVNFLLANLVMTLLIVVSVVPGAVVLGISLVPIIKGGGANPMTAVGILMAVGGLVLALIPAFVLGTMWLFSFPLICDRQMDFWKAMETSRKLVFQRIGSTLLLGIACGALYIAGLLACFVGVFFTLPIMAGAIAYAYDDITSGAGGAAENPLPALR